VPQYGEIADLPLELSIVEKRLVFGKVNAYKKDCANFFWATLYVLGWTLHLLIVAAALRVWVVVVTGLFVVPGLNGGDQVNRRATGHVQVLPDGLRRQTTGVHVGRLAMLPHTTCRPGLRHRRQNVVPRLHTRGPSPHWTNFWTFCTQFYHRRRRRGQGGHVPPLKIREKYFSGNYYVKSGHFSGKHYVKFGNFVNIPGKYPKN